MLDYPGMVGSMREHVNPGQVRLVPYRPDAAVRDVLHAAGIALDLSEPRAVVSTNRSLSVRATELLRRVNHGGELDRSTRRELVALLRELDSGAAPDLDEPNLAASDVAAASTGDAALEQELGVPRGWLSGG